MPKLGDIALAQDLGFKSGKHQAIWAACADCGKERWVLLRKGKPQSERCHPCGAKIAGKKKAKTSGPAHWHWRGGRHTNKNGYISVWVAPDSPFAAMRDRDGQVGEHRLVMAKQLGRCLESWELVHHRNHDKHDNSPENLEIVTKSANSSRSYDMESLIARVKELERELRQCRDTIEGLQAKTS